MAEPTFTSAVITNTATDTIVTLTYADEASATLAATGTFSVITNGANNVVKTVVASGLTVILTLTTPVPDTATLEVTRAAATPRPTASATASAAPEPWDDVVVPELDITKLRKVWVQYSNTDLEKEDLGEDFPLNVCWYESTAKRLAKGTYILKGDGPVEPFKVLRYVDKEYLPIEAVNIILPTKKDVYDQVTLDARTAAYKRATDLGLTEEQIMALMGLSVDEIAELDPPTPTGSATPTPTP